MGEFYHDLGAIAGNGLRILSRVDGILNANQYVHILDNYLRDAFNQYRNALDYFMEDNDPKHGGPHGARLTRDCFQNNPYIIRLATKFPGSQSN